MRRCIHSNSNQTRAEENRLLTDDWRGDAACIAFASAPPPDASQYAEAMSKGLLRLSERPCSCRRRRAFSRGLPGSGASLPRLLGVRVLVNSSAVFEEGGGEDFDQGSSFCSGTRQAFPSPPTTANNSSRIPRNHCHPASESVSLPGSQIGWVSFRPQTTAIRLDLCPHFPIPLFVTWVIHWT